jgi:phage terminase small subunit
MPALKNPRRERLAQFLAQGKTTGDAYELAGYKRNASNASHMARNKEITNRLTEINNETLERERKVTAIATERCAITKKTLIDMAKDLYEQAKEAGQTAAAVAALKEIGVLTGIRIERSERGQPGEFDWVEKLSVEELRLLAAGKLDIASYRKDEDALGRSRLN